MKNQKNLAKLCMIPAGQHQVKQIQDHHNQNPLRSDTPPGMLKKIQDHKKNEDRCKGK